MGLRWMVSPSFPLLISLFTHPSLLPPSFSHCSGQLPSITVMGRPQHWGRLCVWIEGEGGVGKEGGDVYMDVMRGRDSCWHWSKWYTFTGMFPCVWACMAVSMPVHLCICVICPQGNWLATRHGCCSNDAVTTTVWHLWRINIFHLEWSYYPLHVVTK